MKKLFLLLALIFAFTASVCATPVTVSNSTQTNFNPSNLSGDVTGIAVSVTNSSTTVTSSAAFRAAWVGMSGFRVSINGTAYTVAYVTSQSSLTLTANYAGATGAASMTLYKYVEVRFYSNISFRPLGSSEVIQVGTPGSGSWFKRFAAGIVNEMGVNTLYIPQFIVESTTDSADNNTARYTIGFYRPDSSLIQYYTCSGASQLRIPPTTPTTLADICIYNSSAVVITDNTAYTKAQIDARFPSCSSGQMIYYAATGQTQSCLTVGSGLSIAGGTITAAGGGGGITGSGTTNYVPIWTSATTQGASQLFYDGANSRFQSQKDILIFTTAASSKLLIDSDQVVIEGSATRITSAHMQTMKAVASQTGQYLRFLDSSSALKFAVDADGDMYPRGVTTAWPAANAVGVLTNNGSGTLTWGTASGTVTGSGTTNYLPIWTSASAIGTSEMFYDGVNTRFQSQKDILIFTTAANSRLLIDTSVTIEGSDTRVTSAHMLNLKGVASQTGDFERFLDSSSNILYRVTSAGNVHPRGVSTTWPSANSTGVLTNNGAGTLTWGASTATNVRQALNVKTDYACVGDGVTDDTTCFQNALNAAMAAGGKIVYAPAGTYLVTGLTISSPIVLVGDGDKKTVISSATNAAILNLTAATSADFRGATVEDIAIQGTVTAGSSQIGINATDASFVHSIRINRVTISNTGSFGLYVGKAFSSSFSNIFIDNTAGYGLLYDGATQPGNRFENVYVGLLRASAPTAFRIKSGDFNCSNCNGVNNVIASSNWMVIGKKSGTDGDVTNSSATAELYHCNIESWTLTGIRLYHGSSVDLKGRTSIAGDSGTAAASKFGIYHELNQDGVDFFAQFIKRGEIEDEADFADGVAAYNNSQPIQCNGFCPFQLTGIGAGAGGATLSTYRNVTGTQNVKLSRADGRHSKTAITATTTISQPGPSYYEVDSTAGAVTLTLEWAAWHQNAQTPIVIKDTGGLAATNNITVAGGGGGTVGSGTHVINQNGGAVILMPDGNTGVGNWRIISTYPSTGGSGTTINPTNNVIPYRLNSTTFSDSPITVSGSVLSVGADTNPATDNLRDLGTASLHWRVAYTNRTRADGGTTALPAFTGSDTDTGISFPGLNEVEINTSGTQRLWITNGNANFAINLRPLTANTYDAGSATDTWRSAYFATSVFSPLHNWNSGGTIFDSTGAGSPEGVVTASIGSVYRNTTNGDIYRKTSGAGNTGWTLGGGGSATPCGSSGNLQWNNAGACAGMAGSTVTTLGYLTLAPTASSSGSPTLLTYTGPAHTALAADTEASDFNFNLARTVQFTAGGGTFSIQRAVRFQPPTYAFTSADTITAACTVCISGSPVAGTNATLTTRFSLWVESGMSNFDDVVNIGTGSSLASDDYLLFPFIGATNSSGPAIRWGSSASYASQSSIFLSNGFTFQGASSTHDPVKIRTGTGTSSDGTLVFEFRPGDGIFNFTPSSSVTASRHELEVIDVTSTGTPAAGFGGQITYKGESSTTNTQQMGSLNWAWTDATHATRTSKLFIQTVLNAGSLTEVFSVQAAQNYGAVEFDNGNKTGAWTVDWNAGNNQKVTATGNFTTVTFSNIKAGARYTLRVVQDATGGRTWTPPTLFKLPGGVPGNVLTGSVGANDMFDCISSDGTNLYCNGLFDIKNP